MATITAKAAYPTVPGEIRWYPMAATQTFKKGEFVYLNMSGQLAVCAADPNGIAGMAMADATVVAGSTTTTNVACPITIAKRGQQFTMHVTNGGSETATAANMVGRQYSLYVASNIHYLDTADRTNKRFVVDAIAGEDTVGDTTGRVVVEIVKGYAQLDQTTS